MSAERVAREHYARRKRLSNSVAGLARELWSRVSPDDLDGSWARILPQLVLGVTGAQLAAARPADAYADEVLAEQGIESAAEGRVVPAALAGVASDGRPLDSLLQNPITVVKAGIAGGATVQQSLAAGYANLDLLVRTQLADAGRAADQVAIATRPAVTGYVRLLVGDSCSRCVVLAGRRYAWSQGFPRHPRCDCIHVPAAEFSADDIRTDPRAYFDSLNQAEQDKAFTKAGAEAIRAGADIGQVVNARRGMQTASVFGRDVLVTTEGTTVRGNFGRARRGGDQTRRDGQRVRSTTQIRLMPEQIMLEADGDRDEAIRLLRLHGYLTAPAPRTSSTAPVARPPAARPDPVPEPIPEPEPAQALDAASLLRYGIDSGIREEQRLTGGAVGQVHLVTFNDGSQAIRKVAGQQMFGNSPARLTDNEVLAAKVGQALRAPVPTVVRTGDTEVFMEYVPQARPGMWLFRGYGVGEQRLKVAEFMQNAGDDGRRLGLLDLIIANDDRHNENWLVREDGSIVGIDHGLSWPVSAIKPSVVANEKPRFSSPFAKVLNPAPVADAPNQGYVVNDFTPADIDWAEQRLEALRPDFDELGHGALLDYSLARLRQLRPWARGTRDRIRP